MRKGYDFSKGRRGSVVREKGKTRITMYLDDAVIARFRALSEKTGKRYQTLINDASRTQLEQNEGPLTANTVRKIIREELAHG